MLVRIKVEAGWCGGWGFIVGWDRLSYVHCFSLQDWQAPYREGAQSSRSETLKHQRERHYPERTRKQKPITQTHTQIHTHRTRPEIKMFDKKSAWPDATLGKKKQKRTKKQLTSFTLISLSFSIKDNLSVFWTGYLCQLQICTGDYTMWLSKLCLLATCRYNKGGERLRMHACNECLCEYACSLPVHNPPYIVLFMNENITISACL